MQTIKLAALVMAMAVALALPDGLRAQEMPGRITVTGEGKVSAAPDMAVLTLGVTAENAQADLAMQEMREGMAAVLARLEAAGIAERDVQTSGLSLDPRWSDRRESSEPPRIESFVASSQVTIRLRALETLGGLLDGLVEDGANDLRGLHFALQEPQPLEDDARRAAVADAMRKAALYAEAAGVALGPILSISEQGGVQPRMMRAEMAAFAADAGMPVAAGELEVAAVVTITYALGEVE